MTKKLGATAVFSEAALARATGGVFVRRAGKPVCRVSIDSRAVTESSLFIPLRGKRVDGHDFIPQALGRGAAAVLVESAFWQANAVELAELFEKTDAACMVVDDTLLALQDLARAHLARFPKLFRVGITGSSGKTTTKELIGAILAKQAPTFVSSGNLNSEIGVPLSAFAVTPEHVFAVFEMGIDHENEMDVLASIVRPDLAVITNIGTAHVGMLGSREKIAAEKKKIAKYLKKDEALFIFEGEEYLDFLSDGPRGRVIRYGPESTQGLRGSESLGLDGFVIDWEELRIRFPLVGVHNYYNALAAVSVAVFLDIPPLHIKAGLEEAAPLFGRSEVIRGAVSIIKDCYNANPDSMEKALRFLHEVPWPGRKIAVLGSMRELGGDTAVLHRGIGKFARALGLDFIFFYGEEMKDAFTALKEEQFQGRAEGYTDFDLLATRVTEEVREGDLVLVKGSRALELERLIEPLQKIHGKGKNR